MENFLLYQCMFCGPITLLLMILFPFILNKRQARFGGQRSPMRYIGIPLRHDPSNLEVGVKGAYQALCILSWIIFIAARVFVVIESFISLHLLPPDAFQSVKWTDVNFCCREGMVWVMHSFVGFKYISFGGLYYVMRV